MTTQTNPEGTLAEADLSALRSAVTGEVIAPADAGYEEARQVWNGMIDKRPAVIVRPRSAQEVAAAVNFAREHGLKVSVRGGGHNVAGGAVNDGGLVIDLSLMRGVEVDADARLVRAQGGALLGDIDAATQPYGLAVPVGVVSETGIAGLTLGGGIGHLMRKYGSASDNLVSAEVVTADGSVLTASAQENPDLFWALRGGGQGAGAVTSFEFRAHPIGPEVFMCFVFHPWDQARELLRFFRDFSASAPEEVGLITFAATVPDDENFPAEARGKKAFVFLSTYAGDPAEGERALQPIRDAATPLVDLSGPMQWADLQRALDEDYPRGIRYYWKATYIKGLDDETIESLIEHGSKYPSPRTTLDIWCLGGALARPQEDTAFPHRDAPFGVTFESNWEDPADDEANIRWAREGWQDMQRFSTGGLYVNFPGQAEEPDFGRLAYGENWDRLQAVRRKYDPEGLFV